MSFATSFPLIRKARDLLPPGGTAIDVGTGWFHHDAFLLRLVSDSVIHLFDVEDKAKLSFIRNYLQHLIVNSARIAQALDIEALSVERKLMPLLKLKTRHEIYDACNFVPCITRRTDEPFLPAGSVDVMVSNCVLTHIPPDVIVPELTAFRYMSKDSGRMAHAGRPRGPLGLPRPVRQPVQLLPLLGPNLPPVLRDKDGIPEPDGQKRVARAL